MWHMYSNEKVSKHISKLFTFYSFYGIKLREDKQLYVSTMIYKFNYTSGGKRCISMDYYFYLALLLNIL